MIYFGPHFVDLYEGICRFRLYFRLGLMYGSEFPGFEGFRVIRVRAGHWVTFSIDLVSLPETRKPGTGKGQNS